MHLSTSDLSSRLRLASIDDPSLRRRVQALLDAKTKPLGALGRLEVLALQCALVLRDERARLHRPQLVVFAADHGIAAQAVSAYPREVTRQMVLNFLAGGAAVSVLARQHGLALTVADCGVAADFASHPGLVHLKVEGAEHGTADSTIAPAMTGPQCDAAIALGQRLVAGLPGNVLLLGEMGIANTSAAALLMARLTSEPLAACVGRGTGLDDRGLQRKHEALARALQRHPTARSPRDVLAALGGLEIAAMVGAVWQAAADRRVIVVDGFISTAAVAVAAAQHPAVLGYCVFSHCSAESGHARWLRHLGVTPLLDLGLRLGEGSGAALAWPLLASACRLLDQMASFDSAGVSGASREVAPVAPGVRDEPGEHGTSGVGGVGCVAGMTGVASSAGDAGVADGADGADRPDGADGASADGADGAGRAGPADTSNPCPERS